MSQSKSSFFPCYPLTFLGSTRRAILKQKNSQLHQTYLGNGPTAAQPNILPKSYSRRQRQFANTSDNLGSVLSNESVMN